MKKDTISKRQLERYPKYLVYLRKLQEESIDHISSRALAEVFECSEEQVRKDFQAISKDKGKPKSGRSVQSMVNDLEDFLDYHNNKDAVIVGVGKLATAILNYDGFSKYGLSILAGFDIEKSGYEINGKKIYHIDQMEKIIKKLNVKIAIITTTKQAAQPTADRLMKCGIKAIWNFAPTRLEVNDDVAVEDVDLAASLAVLSHKLRQKENAKNE